jgi:hypothetical protein
MQGKNLPTMYLLCVGRLSDYPLHLVMHSASLSLSSFAPHVIAQLYLALIEAVSRGKLCYLRDPATSIPLSSSPPFGSVTLYSLGRVQLLQVGHALTVEWDARWENLVLFPFPFVSPSSTGSPNRLRPVGKHRIPLKG